MTVEEPVSIDSEGVISNIERVSALESRAGLTLNGIMATVRPNRSQDGKYVVDVLAEIAATNGDTFEGSVDIHVNCYKGSQLCGSNSDWLDGKSFFSVQNMDMNVYCTSKPNRIKVLIKKDG